MGFFFKLKAFFTTPIPFLTTTAEELEGRNYLLFALSPTEFELKLRNGRIGLLTLQTGGGIQSGHIVVGNDSWSLKPTEKVWPKEFTVKKLGGDEYSLRFNQLGFRGKMDMDGKTYSFTAGGGRVITIHQWTWEDPDGRERHMDVSSRGHFPDGVSVTPVEQAEACPNAPLLILIARYIQRVYVGGHWDDRSTASRPS